MKPLLRQLVYKILGLLDRALQYCVRPSSAHLCFSSIPDYSDNAFYLYRHALRELSGYTLIWLLHDLQTADRIRQEFAQSMADRPDSRLMLKIIKWHSLAGYWHFLRSQTAFHTHGMFAFSRHAHQRRRVALWHGMPIKSIGRLNTRTPNPRPTFATHAVCTSPFFRYIMACAFGLPANQVLLAGQPRCDVLHRTAPPCHSREEVRSALGLARDEHLLVWLPTYRSEALWQHDNARPQSFLDDLDDDALAHFGATTAQHRCHVVLKLHPMEMGEIAAHLDSHPHIHVYDSQAWLDSGLQLYDLLAASDALVSDVSSVLIDYLPTDRPIGVFGFDPARYPRDLLFPITYLSSCPTVFDLSAPQQSQRFFTALMQTSRPEPRGNDLRLVFHTNTVRHASENLLTQLDLPLRVPADSPESRDNKSDDITTLR